MTLKDEVLDYQTMKQMFFGLMVLLFVGLCTYQGYVSFYQRLLMSNGGQAIAAAPLDTKAAYSLGGTMGHFLANRIEADNQLGFNIGSDQVLLGFINALEGASTLKSAEVQTLLADYAKARHDWLPSSEHAPDKDTLTAKQLSLQQLFAYALGVSKGDFLLAQLDLYSAKRVAIDDVLLKVGFRDGINNQLDMTPSEMKCVLKQYGLWGEVEYQTDEADLPKLTDKKMLS